MYKNVPNNPEICWACDGEGFTMVGMAVKNCPNCEGTGLIISEEKDEKIIK